MNRQRARALAASMILPLGLLVYLALRVISLFTRIRVGMLTYDRIGHLSFDTETFLRKRRLGLIDGICLLVSGRNPCNRQLLTMIKRAAPVLDFPLASFFYVHGLLPFIKDSGLVLDFAHKSWEYPIFDTAPAQLRFEPSEEARGRRALEEMGVTPGAPFVCFHARDKAYLDNAFSHRSREGWSYHDYRDCDIANCVPAAEFLASQGLFALRMGHTVEKALTTNNPRIIDYASKFRSDFLDVYLLARCKFFLGNTAGIYALATTFDVPVAVANWAPFSLTPFRRGDMVMHKKYLEIRSGRLVPFRELFALGAQSWFSSEDYSRAGIKLVENSPKEILEFAQEMNARLDGVWTPAPEDVELQERFWNLFPKDHPARGRLCRVGAGFLRDNRSLLD